MRHLQSLPHVACASVQAFVLRRKLVALFKLAQQTLTQQQHYDWGLRALKTCLALAGKHLHEHRSATPGQQIADSVQTQLLVRSVWLATMPKLTFDDSTRQTSTVSVYGNTMMLCW